MILPQSVACGAGTTIFPSPPGVDDLGRPSGEHAWKGHGHALNEHVEQGSPPSSGVGLARGR